MKGRTKVQQKDGGYRKLLAKIIILIGIAFLASYAYGFQVGYGAQENAIRGAPSQAGETETIEELATPMAGPASAPGSIGEREPASAIPERVMQLQLSEEEAEIYGAIDEAIRGFRDAEFVVNNTSGIGTHRISEIAQAAGCNPEFFWVDKMLWQRAKDIGNGNKQYTIEIGYWMSEEERDAALVQLEPVVTDFLSKSAGVSDVFEASTLANNFLRDSVGYQYDKSVQLSHPYDDILGPFLESKSICSGYAKSYSYLMSLLGYESAYCTGVNSEGIYHAWNEIRDGDDIYYTDVTENSCLGKNAVLNIPIGQNDGRELDHERWFEPFCTEERSPKPASGQCGTEPTARPTPVPSKTLAK